MAMDNSNCGPVTWFQPIAFLRFHNIANLLRHVYWESVTRSERYEIISLSVFCASASAITLLCVWFLLFYVFVCFLCRHRPYLVYRRNTWAVYFQLWQIVVCVSTDLVTYIHACVAAVEVAVIAVVVICVEFYQLWVTAGLSGHIYLCIIASCVTFFVIIAFVMPLFLCVSLLVCSSVSIYSRLYRLFCILNLHLSCF